MSPPSPRRRLRPAERRRRRATLGGVGAVVLAFGAVAFAVQPDGSAPRIPVRVVTPVAAAPPEPPPAPAPPPPAPPAATPVKIAAVGDISMGSVGYALPPDAGAGFFAPVAPQLEADLTLGNLEGPLTDGGTSKCPPPPPPPPPGGTTTAPTAPSACFAFRTPTDHAPALAEAGFDVLSLANNHAYDFGAQGAADTVATLDALDIAATGLAGADVPVRRVGTTRVAVLGFAPYSFADPLLDLEAAAARVAEAAAEAEIVVVSVHMGAEGTDAVHVDPGPETYLGEERGDPMAFSRAVIDAGADLVLGHGPHVLRGMEVYEGRLIAYSMGNFAGYGVFALDGALSESMVLRVDLAPDGSFRGGRILPTSLVGEGTPAPGGDAIATVAELSEADFGAAAPRIAPDGRLRPPVP